MKKSVLRLWLPSAIAGALLAFNSGAALVYTIPKSLRGRRMSSRIEEERRRVAELDRLRISLRNRAAILDKNANDAEEFYRRVRGDRGSTVATQQRLWRMAVESGLAPKTLDCAQEELKAVPLTRLRVTMPLSGSYDQLLSFLGRVEKAKQFFIVDGIRLSSKKERIRDLGIEISAYFHTGASGERSRVESVARRPRRRRQ